MTREFLTKEGQKYGHFALIKYQYIEELQTYLRELIHLPTGAQVMHLENEDPENLFCLSFKTLPDSSNGAPHILEHTVLCGSRKFPVKDPFFAMSRRSLNTFMNALTGSDFTCYPAASQVEKDFYNLLEVYLDAVFHPQLKELSFLQEGCRLEFTRSKDPKSPLGFKGIVYNEMKGALSSIDARLWHAMMHYLVPDLPYAFNSGGDPKEIPNLTYADLIAFHEKYYHPSRCLFFFYGNFPLQKHLDVLEEQALKGIQKLPPLDGIGHQTRFKKPIKGQLTYPTSERKKLDQKHIHTFSFLTTPLLNQEEVFALTILDSVLMDTDASILKKALLETKLCIQADSFLDIEMTEVPLLVVCRGCKQNDADKVEKALFDALKKISKEGIPFHLIEASIHQLEFSRMEIGGGSSPFGLTLFMRSALSKQHGCAPEQALTVHALFENILEKAKDLHFFSPLIEKYFLHNKHFVRLSFAPDPDLNAKEAKEEKEQLKKIQQGLNESQKLKILDQAKKLKEYQKQTETQKIHCLPKVTLDDIPAETRHFSLEKRQQSHLEIFHHETFTNHILYADLIFDLPHLSEDELFDLQLFLSLWTELGMGERNYNQNLEFIHAHTGGIGSHASLYVQATDNSHLKPSLQIRGKSLERKMDKLFFLFKEMITAPRLDEKKRIMDLVKKFAPALQNRLVQNAMRYATQISLSGFSVPSHINQLWYGLDFYKKIQSLASNLPKKIDSLIEKLYHIKDKLLCNGTPHLILSCDQKLFDALDKQGFFGLPELLCKKGPPWKSDYPLQKVSHQARIIPSSVAFTVEGFQVVPYSHEDAPALQVATVLMENKILHHRVREQGGAYGVGANYNSLWGNFYFYAYRDPHIAHTLHTFHDSIEEICAKEFENQDLEEAKLGIIQHYDAPTSPGSRAMVAYIWQREGKTRQMRQNFRDALLQLKPEDIQVTLERNLKRQIDQGVVVTFAGKELLEKELSLIEDKKIEILPIES